MPYKRYGRRILTILLVLILAFPNCEVQEDAEAKDVVD